MARVAGLPEAIAEAVAGLPDDVAIVGAGDPPTVAFVDTTQAQWEATIGAVRAAFLEAQSAVREGARRVIFVSHVAAVRPVQGAALPATAGAFFHTLAQVAAAELGPEGVTVNVVAPGFVDDGRFDDATPVGRATTPADIAAICAFLASDAAAYVTGVVIPVDGGFSITKTGGGSPLVS
jgi:NAD(P)-dependent dehydrogenase (short-subunit alcohol dehydrogenase family)